MTAPLGLCLAFQNMPLAVYREVAAHLRQLPSLGVELLPQTSQEFDYLQSQVGGIRIWCLSENGHTTTGNPLEMLDPQDDRQRLQAIIQYYNDRYPLDITQPH